MKFKLTKLARKSNKRLRRYFKKTAKTSLSLSWLLVSVAIGLSGAIIYNQPRLTNQSSNQAAEHLIKLLNKGTGTSPKPINKIAKSSPRVGSRTSAVITMLGPAQNNNFFSLYPSWSQNFATNTSGKLDSKDWEVYQGPAQNSNNEAEYYTDSSTNLHIKNGALTLEATKQPEPQNYDYASARLDTDNKISFLYGRLDITAKLPDGVGTWPAAWLLPANNTYENLSPASDSTRYLNGGEIDMVEEVGFNPNVEYGIVHTLADLSNPNGVGSYSVVYVPNNNVSYNKYSLLWTPSSITFEVNDQPFYTYNKSTGADYTTWPFDQPFYLILDLAIGGVWGGEDVNQFPPSGIDNSIFPATMDISSIYYYNYVGAPVANND